MRSVWNGTIAFGLVSIPIKLYSAVNHQSIGFKMLCEKCMKPVKYERYCEGCKKKVKYDEIIKALDLGGGNYLPFTKEELEKIKPEKSDRIEIREFVQSSQIDPIYYQKPYFCGPAKAKERAYFLFKKVLSDSKKIAIGKFVMREKEYVCAIRPYEGGLLLSTLSYNYEVRDINDIKELQDVPELKKDELQMAAALVEQLTQKKFNLEEFKDEFAEKLKKMIDKKEKISVEDGETPQPLEEESLIDALKASLS